MKSSEGQHYQLTTGKRTFIKWGEHYIVGRGQVSWKVVVKFRTALYGVLPGTPGKDTFLGTEGYLAGRL